MPMAKKPAEKQQQETIQKPPHVGRTFMDVFDVYATYITDQKDRKMIENAYKFAEEKHRGVYRKSGEPYIEHPIEVCYIIAKLQAGPATIAAGFLHDVVEDSDATVEDIRKLFGDDVAFLVDSLTKIQRMKLSHRTEADFEAEDHRKIFLGMAKDVRVIIIKLADRLHNMRTLESLSPARQKALSEETLDVFVPIAHRLGIFTIQSELQDLSLKFLEPEKYKEILRLLDEREKNRNESLSAVKKRIADVIYEHNITFRMESRIKSIYSIYRKMYKKNYNFDEIYDVLAIRIITQSEMNCYEILGLIHAMYKPVPGRFKDYIAMPKPNLYQSLHTTIVAGDGNIYEIQIRTEEMDSIAETGVAAHWKYKEGAHYNPKEEQKDIEEKLHWFRDFINFSSEKEYDGEDAKDYMAALSNDIFNANVYVFTPMGKVIDLPQGSTVLDFAYRIHTKVGESAVGAVVNGSIVPLNTVLKTGDVCEIKTSKNSKGPNEGWLSIVKTAGAKSRIRKFLNEKNAEAFESSNIEKGKNAITEAFRARGYNDENEVMNLISQQKVLDEFHAASVDDLLKMIGARNPTPSSVIEFLNIRTKALPKTSTHYSSQDSKNPVLVEGGSNIAISLSKCCSPIPGDDIIGFITKGKGITVHRVNCPNIKGSSRVIPVRWNEDLGISSYPVDVEVYANDRPNLLADILQVMASKGLAVHDLHAHLTTETMNTVVSMKIFVSSAKILEDTFSMLLGIKGVYTCERIIH